MGVPSISVSLRVGAKKSDLRKIRANGDIPAVIYGKSMPPISVVLPGIEYRKKIAGHRMIQVNLQGQSTPAIIQDVMYHPVDRNVLHVELHAISMGEEITAPVPVYLEGLEQLERRGGIVQQQLREVQVTGFANRIPDFLQINVASLRLGDTLFAKDVPLPDGVVLATAQDELVVSVVAPKTTVTENPADPEAVTSQQSL